MLPLAGSELPISCEQLAEAIRGGLQRSGVSPREIRVAGAFPACTDVAIDLSGGSVDRQLRLSTSGTPTGNVITAERVEIKAQPLHLEGTPLQLELQAMEAGLEFMKDAQGALLLTLARAAQGTLMLEAQRSDLEATLKRYATEAAKKQGADIKSAKLEFQSKGPRTLNFRAEVTAKVFVMTAKVTVTGTAEVDDQLNLRLSDLQSSGDGMLGNMAGSFLRPRFAELEKRTILCAHTL